MWKRYAGYVTVTAVVLLAGCTSSNAKNNRSAAQTVTTPIASPAAGRSLASPGTPQPTIALGTAVVGQAGQIVCFNGLHAYNYKGKLALSLGPGANQSQIGALANLLTDVAFDGAFQAPNASALNVHFGGANGSQDLETIRIGSRFFQRAAGGAWQETTGSGPILSVLGQVDPQRLCTQTLARLDTSNSKPAGDTINGVKALHYSFGPQELAQVPGLFGERGGQQGAAPDAHLDVWTAAATGYPVRIVLTSSFAEAGGAPSTLSVQMDIGDFNGSDIAIQAPQ